MERIGLPPSSALHGIREDGPFLFGQSVRLATCEAYETVQQLL
jgi:hypothetical protein